MQRKTHQCLNDIKWFCVSISVTCELLHVTHNVWVYAVALVFVDLPYGGLEWEDNNNETFFFRLCFIRFFYKHQFYSILWISLKIEQTEKSVKRWKKKLHFMTCQSRYETCSVFSVRCSVFIVQCSVSNRMNILIVFCGRRTMQRKYIIDNQQ